MKRMKIKLCSQKNEQAARMNKQFAQEAAAFQQNEWGS